MSQMFIFPYCLYNYSEPLKSRPPLKNGQPLKSRPPLYKCQTGWPQCALCSEFLYTVYYENIPSWALNGRILCRRERAVSIFLNVILFNSSPSEYRRWSLRTTSTADSNDIRVVFVNNWIISLFYKIIIIHVHFIVNNYI